MVFNSLGFIVFFAVILVLYYAPFLGWVNKKRMLLFSSYVFYGLWNPPLIILLWISTMVDWIAGNKIYQETKPNRRKFWLWVSMVVNLGFLAFFKYGNFLLENFISFVNLAGFSYEPLPMNIILPVGISFYTFQTMSYTIDVYQRKLEPARTFLDFALYVTFFPQLVAGPIVRAGDLVTQFYEEKKAKADLFIWGLFLLTLGLFEKIVMADTLFSGAADTVFNADKMLNFWDAWAGVLAFSAQIFFDFAGYSSCAIGISYMLGFTLTDNFLYPYGSIGFSEFWRRWHISLSSWLRDYLYIPLGGNRFGLTRMYVALMLTMLLGGLWHGAAWTFVFWGFLHGTYLIIERMLKGRFRFEMNWWNGLLLAGLTFTLVNFTWVFFRAEDFATAWNIITAMVTGFGEGEKMLGYFDLTKVFVLSGILFLTHYYMRHHTVRMVTSSAGPWITGIAWATMVFLICISHGQGEQFIYFQF